MSIASPSPQSTNSCLVFRQEVNYFLLLAISSYMLLWVAVFNGYPVFFPDSGQYLWVSFDLQPPIYRTIGYSIFIRLVSFGASPWLVVIAQSVIAIFVLHSAFDFIVRQNGASERRGLVFLGLMVFLAFGTTLPWFVGQIMPDVFTGLSLLSLFLLLYDSKISLERTVLLSAVLCISIGTHITHLLAVTLLLLAILVLRTFGMFREFWPTRSIKGIVACVLVPILGHHCPTCAIELALGLWIYSLSGKTCLLVRQADREWIGCRLSATELRNRTVHCLQISPQLAQVFGRVSLGLASTFERNGRLERSSG